ncbi:MAG: hypothetical protein Q9195_002685 [Heterodermia aff. obscurata]
MFRRAANSTSNAQAYISEKLDELSITSSPPIQEKDPNFGTNPIIKTFYEGNGSCDGFYNWVETPPKQLKEKKARAYDQVAIMLYKVKDHDKNTVGGRTPLKIHSIDVQSPLLTTALKPVVQDVGVFLDEHDVAKFAEPFKPLFFCYDKILALRGQAMGDVIFREHLHLLTQLMADLFGEMRKKLRSLQQSHLMSFKLAWTYFPKDSTIVAATEDCERLFQVLDTEYVCDAGGSRLEILCQHIVFTGAAFEWETTTLKIPGFSGNVPVSSLPVYPIDYHDNIEGLKARLTARGKKVFEYQGLEYREYTGIGLDEKCRKYNVAGRILVDFHGYAKHHLGLQRSEKSPNNEDSPAEEGAYLKPLSDKEQQANKAAMLKRSKDLMYICPMISGFAMKDKVWRTLSPSSIALLEEAYILTVKFYVDDIRPLQWNDEAYDHLVYPEGQKDLVLTFVENHQRTKAGLDDVIVGKGQGLVHLLSGPPGTGKTLLAEAVADRTRRPLYYLHAEELGTKADLLGEKVKKVFEMATEWNAVILLDEADVFMAERSYADIARNELVSIFLRELEYFKGIIFLTTNLSSTIDAAFRSRVNIHLFFSPLSFTYRAQLWQKFLDRLLAESPSPNPPFRRLEPSEIEQLAAWELNGREIKNAVKTARNWCLCKGYEISVERIESAIMVTAPMASKQVRDT